MHSVIKIYSRFNKIQIRRKSYITNIKNSRWLSSNANNVVESTENDGSIQSHENQNKYFSFMKNLFTGKIDTNILVFPEPLEEEDLHKLNKTVNHIEQFYKDNVEPSKLDKDGKISKELFTKLKQMGFFGQSISKEYGGLGLSATERGRILEVMSLDASLAITLSSHQDFAAKCIELSGTESQKKKYLPLLASGDCISAFCLSENIRSLVMYDGTDISNIETIAVHNEETGNFTISGQKNFVVNGSIADVYVVFARVPTLNTLGDTEYDITCFIVDKSSIGVTTSDHNQQTGVRSADVCSVNFENVVIPQENRLDEIGQGYTVAIQAMNNSRVMMATNGISILQKLLGETVEHCIHTEHFGEKLMEFGMVQDRLVKVASNIYAMESTAYLTAAIVDHCPEAEVSLETAALRIFSTEQTIACIRECQQIFGTGGCTENLSFSRYLRDAEVFSTYETSNDILRLYLSITSLQYAVDELKEIIRKIRDPFNNVGFIFKHGLQTKGLSTSTNRKLLLHDHVHPHLSFLAETLEERIKELVKVIEKFVLISKDGILKETMSLRRFSDIGIDMYTSTAVLARASRSFSIGLQHSDHEIYLARAYCNEAFKRIKNNIDEIGLSKYNNGDEERRKCAEQLINNKGYTAVHPLTRNW